MFAVEAKVEALTSRLVDVKMESRELTEAVRHLKTVLHEVVTYIVTALYFVILRVTQQSSYKYNLIPWSRHRDLNRLVPVTSSTYVNLVLLRSDL